MWPFQRDCGPRRQFLVPVYTFIPGIFQAYGKEISEKRITLFS
jgi:hypothetical protein